MGAKPSTHVSQDTIVTCCLQTVNAFGPVFVKAVAIESLEACEAPPTGPALALQLPPAATEPLKRGWLEKLGEKKKTWKRRYFVATEEAENFVVYYFVSEKDSETRAKAKGAFHPCGYAVADAPVAQGWCLCLTPLASHKRTFLLRCETQEELARWKLVLRFASQKCQPPLSADSVLASAFVQAYARTRRQMKLDAAGSAIIDRAEAEQLVVLCAQACEANVLPDRTPTANSALATAHSSSAATAATATAGSTADAPLAPPAQLSPELEALQSVDRVAREVVATAWPAICARIALRRDFIDRQVKAGSLAALQTERAARLAETRARIGPLLVEATADGATRAKLGIVLGALLKPQYKAHKEAARLFFGRCSEIIDRGLRETELRSFYRDTRWQDAALLPALRKIWALTRGEVDEHEPEASVRLLSELTVPLPQLVEVLQGVSLQEVESRCEDEIRALVGAGIYSFVARVEAARGKVPPLLCLHEVTRDLMNDSKIRQRNCVVSLVQKAVAIPELRARAASLPSVLDFLRSSVVQSPDFETVPPLAPRSASVAAATGGGSAGGTDSVAPLPQTAVPRATPVRVNKKARSETEEALRAQPVSNIFTDPDWLLDAALGAAAEQLVVTVGDPLITAMVARMDKLLAKVIF